MIKLFMIITLLSTCVFSHSLVSVEMSENSVKQGDAIWVKIKTAKKLKSGHIKLGKYKFKLFNKNNSKTALLSTIGVSRYAKPKKTRIYFSFVFEDSSEYKTSLPFTITDANFKQEHITLTPKKQKIKKDKKSRTNENVIISKKFKTISNRKKYEGKFIWPVKGKFTSEFGTQRVYNNTPGWKHSGIDISGNTGTPIKATQSGTIILAKSLKVHGNTVMIDHGLGIVSIYNHLNKISVKLNDNVNKGDIIGTVGSTGIATGSHLHFGISVQSIRINPRTWLEKTSKISI